MPTCLYHYTSSKALKGMLEEVHESADNDGLLFHLCNPMQSNDKREVNFFEDYVYKGFLGDKLKKAVDNISESTGKPYTISFIHHYEGSIVKNFGQRYYPHCEIPMWKMYGDDYTGIRLKFKAMELCSFFAKKSISLQKCEYATINKMKDVGKKIRKGEETPEQLYKKSVLYKMAHWAYENEWRAVMWAKDSDPNIEKTNNKIYSKCLIPFEYLQEITIGPKAIPEDIDYLQSLPQKRAKMKHVKIKKSKLPIN